MTENSQAANKQLNDLVQPGLQDARHGSVLTVAASLLWLVQAAILAAALGELVGGGGSNTLFWVCVFLSGAVLRALLALVAETKLQRASETVVAIARQRMVAVEAGRASESAFGGAGAIASLASEKLDLLIPYVTRYAPARLRAMVLPLVILLVCTWFSWIVALVLLVAGPLIPVFMALVGLAAKEASQRQLAEVGSLNDLLVSRLPGLLDIRLLGAGQEIERHLLEHMGKVRAKTMAVLRIAFLSSAVLELFAAIGVAMIAVFVGFSLLGTLNFGNWGNALTPTAAIFLLLLAPEFFQPMRDLAAAWHDKASALAVAEEFGCWARSDTASLPGRGETALLLPGPATIEMTGCKAPSGVAIPDMSVTAGQSVALVGASGSGKTSALRIMAGLLMPEIGQLNVAGVPFSPNVADAWRARVGWIPQTPHFMDASIADNIAMGRRGNLGAALAAAGIADVVNALPRGVHTRLGENGGGLSGGEARRLTVARAIFGKPDIILADEPTADLDAETAAVVSECLLREARRGATLVVATHDTEFSSKLGQVVHFGRTA